MDLVSFRTNVNLSFKTTVNSSYDYEFGTILGLLDSVRFWFSTINRGALKSRYYVLHALHVKYMYDCSLQNTFGFS